MKIGAVYRNLGQTLIPLTEKNLDGYVLFLRIQLHIGQWVDNQPIFDEYTKINNTQKANDDQKKRDAVQFVFYKVDDAFEEKTLESTYRESSEIELGVGDRFIEAGKQDEYTVLGFYMREVQKDVTSIKSPMVERRFPYAVNLKPIISFVDVVAKSRDGINKLSLNGLPSFSAFGTEHALNDSDRDTLTQLFYSNSKLAYWSVDAARVSTVVYMKQSKPEPKVNITVDFNAPRKTLRPKQYAEYREFLGEEYTDEFIELIDQLDWGRIAELSKDIPEIKNVVKEIVSQVYVDFLIERRLLKASEPNLFEWLVAPWEQMSDEAYGIWAKYNDAKKDGKIQTAAFTATVDDLQANKRERKKFGIIALRDVGSYGTNDKLLKIANGLERLVISNDTSKNLIEDYEQYVNAIKELNDGETKSFTIPLEDGGFDKAIKILSSQTSKILPKLSMNDIPDEYWVKLESTTSTWTEIEILKLINREPDGYDDKQKVWLVELLYNVYFIDSSNPNYEKAINNYVGDYGNTIYLMVRKPWLGAIGDAQKKYFSTAKIQETSSLQLAGYMRREFYNIAEALASLYANTDYYMKDIAEAIYFANLPEKEHAVVPKEWWEKVDLYNDASIKVDYSKEAIQQLLNMKRLSDLRRLQYVDLFYDIYRIKTDSPYYEKACEILEMIKLSQTGDIYTFYIKEGYEDTVFWAPRLSPIIDPIMTDKGLANLVRHIPDITNAVAKSVEEEGMVAVVNTIYFANNKTPQAKPEPVTNGEDFEWLIHPWRGMMSPEELKKYKTAEGWGENAFIYYSTFECDYKDLGRRQYTMLLCMDMGDSARWKEKLRELKKLEGVVDVEYLGDTYPAIQEAVYGNAPQGYMSAEVVIVNQADYAKASEIIIELPKPSAAPTKYFEWHKEPWEHLLSNAVLEKFVKLNKWNQDAETYEASFTCDYKDKGRKTFTIWLFVNVGSSLAWKEKRGKLEAIEEKIDRSWIMNTYPAIHENIDKMLMASTNYVSSFIISQDDLADAEGILYDFSKAQATQPEPTTTKSATKQFEWLTKPWDELLGQVRIQQLVETQGWKKEAKVLFASFSCDYKGEGSQYFGLVVVQHAGEGKKWAKMRDKIVQLEAKIDPVWILTNYSETAQAISKLEKTVGSRNQDFFVFRHADLKTVMEILTGIKEQTKEPEPKPVSKREPKAKVSKPTEKDELDELLDLDFDDI